MRILILRMDAPLMSFGGTMVDKWGVITEFPAASLLTGLFANALGYDQGQFDVHQRLQRRLRYAARIDRPGQRLLDYQTVDLSQPQFTATGWTTRGVREDRRGGPASSGTHIRLRPYWADRCCIAACTVVPAEEEPTVDDLAGALNKPARPLFIGRKPCLPATRLLAGEVEARSLVEALRAFPDTKQRGEGRGGPTEARQVRAQWPADEASSEGRFEMISDERDWKNQFHSGARPVRRGLITITKGEK